jgi:hypothetical protein
MKNILSDKTLYCYKNFARINLMKKIILIMLTLSLGFAGAFADSFQSNFQTKKAILRYKSNRLKVYLHYPDKSESFAKSTWDVIKKDFQAIHKYFDYLPQSEVHFVVGENENTANGSAQVFPRNFIYLHDFPPFGAESLTISKDWIRSLVVHEYIHILTLEMTHGVLDFFRTFLGSTMKWAQISPRWFSEGIAVWAESHFTGEGRLNEPKIKRFIKNSINENNFCSDPVCFDRPKHYPYGQLPYWLGGFFLEYLEQKKTGTMKCIVHRYSESVPLQLDRMIRMCTSKGLDEQFAEFRNFVKSEKFEQNWKCPIGEESLCQRLEKKFGVIDWFRGSINHSDYAAFVTAPNQEDFANGEEGKKLIVFNRKSNKIKSFYLNYPVSQIYQLEGSNKFAINLLSSVDFSPRLEELSGRLVYVYDAKKNKIKKMSFFSKKCHIYVGEKSCFSYQDSQWRLFKKNEQAQNKFPLVVNGELTTRLNEEKTKKVMGRSEKYFGLKYLDPNYLMFNYFAGGNTLALGFYSSLNDPLNRHNINFGGYYNFGLKEDDSPYSGNISYFYSRENWLLGGGYNKFISQSAFDEVNIFETNYLQLSRNYFFNQWTLTPGVSFTQSSELDQFNFRRKLKEIALFNTFSFRTDKVKSFLRNTDLFLSIGQVQNFSNDPYLKFELGSTTLMQINQKLHLEFLFNYGKIDTDKFAEGLIYGGGADSFFSGVFRYPSYLVPFTNIFGFEMIQSRLGVEWNFMNPFKVVSTGLPIYLRRLNLLGGLEFMKADRLFDPDELRFLREESLVSAYLGLRAKVDFLYIAPLNLDLVGSASGNKAYPATLSFLLGASF